MWPRRADLHGPSAGDRVDLHARAFRQGGHLHRRARRWGGGKALGVRLIHGLEVAEVDEIDRGLHDVAETAARGREHRAEVVEHAVRLRGDVSADELAGLRVDRDLSAEKEKITGADGLRVRADRSGSVERGDGFHARDSRTTP